MIDQLKDILGVNDYSHLSDDQLRDRIRSAESANALERLRSAIDRSPAPSDTSQLRALREAAIARGITHTAVNAHNTT